MNKTKNPFRSTTRILCLLIAGPLSGLAFALVLTFTSPVLPGNVPDSVDAHGVLTYTIPTRPADAVNPNDKIEVP
jgi:hypothetical protein